MSTLRVIDSLSLPGHSSKANEDRCGWTGNRVFVIDGATGVGGDMMDSLEGSDAAWLAQRAKDRLGQPDDTDPADLVRQINTEAGAAFRAAAGGQDEPWRQPTASLYMVRLHADRVSAAGLGDCVLFTINSAGETARQSPMTDHHDLEAETARAALRAGATLIDGASITSAGAMLERERALRARYNTAGGPIWTLGIAPEAADHVRVEPVAVASPLRAILCTDGFAALVDRYQRYSIAGLVETAFAKGLEALGNELRAIENDEDPEGRLYPRMKRSDDATAVLFEIT